MTVMAVYRNGVLHPRQPLDVPEGTEVEVSVPRKPAAKPDDAKLADFAARLAAAKDIREFMAVANEPDDDEPDNAAELFQSMNDHRRENGERLLFSEDEHGRVVWR